MYHSREAKLERVSLLYKKAKGSILQELKNLWNDHKIFSLGQQMVEEYFSYLLGQELKREVKNQIELTKSKRSLLINLNDLRKQRNIILGDLRQKTKMFDTTSTKTEKHACQLCQGLQKLRQINLVYAQTLIDMHSYFSEVIKFSLKNSKICTLFEQLQEDNVFLSKSLLRKYIIFSKTFDPFLLKHFEILRQTNNPRLRQFEGIRELFTITANDEYRLKKAHQFMKNYLRKETSSDDYRRHRVLSKQKTVVHEQSNENDGFRKLSYDMEYSNVLADHEVTMKKQLSLRTEQINSSRHISAEKNAKLKDQVESVLTSIKSTKPYTGPIQFPSINVSPSSKMVPEEISNSHRSNKDSARLKTFSTKRKMRLLNSNLSKVEENEAQFKRLLMRNAIQSKRSKSLSPNIRVRKSIVISTFNENNANPVVSQRLVVQEDQHSVKLQTQTKLNKTQEKQLPSKQTTLVRQNAVIPSGQHVAKVHNLSDVEKQNKNIFQTFSNQKDSSKSQQPQKVPQQYHLTAQQVPVTIQELLQRLKNYNIKPQYRSKFEIGNWVNSIRHNQFYFHKSFLNCTLMAVSLCCALPEGDVMIKYWGPLQHCNEDSSLFLFQKYIEHIEKVTRLKSIYYNALPIKQLAFNSFIKRKERIFERERINPSSIVEDEVPHFLGINFSNIAINKSTPNHQKLIKQEGVKPFKPQTFLIFNYLLLINKLLHPGAFSAVATYRSNLKSIQSAHQGILSQYLNHSAYNSEFKCNYCNLLTFKLRSPIFSAFFIADKGFLKLVGQLCYEDSDSIIICLSMLKYNTKIYFGKGVKNVAAMVEKVKKLKQNETEKVQFSVRMFRKSLRGKINCITLKQQHCYGDLEVNFVWKDYLNGKLSHKVNDSVEVFQDNFFCLIQMEKQMLFAFQVQPSDYVTL